jgi:hypothetical protein
MTRSVLFEMDVFVFCGMPQSSFVDVDTSTGQIVTSRRVAKATAWKDVPTLSI